MTDSIPIAGRPPLPVVSAVEETVAELPDPAIQVPALFGPGIPDEDFDPNVVCVFIYVLTPDRLVPDSSSAEQTDASSPISLDELRLALYETLNDRLPRIYHIGEVRKARTRIFRID